MMLEILWFFYYCKNFIEKMFALLIIMKIISRYKGISKYLNINILPSISFLTLEIIYSEDEFLMRACRDAGCLFLRHIVTIHGLCQSRRQPVVCSKFDDA